MSEFEKVVQEAAEAKKEKKSYVEILRERRALLNELSAKA